jgi:hypothetical protein
MAAHSDRFPSARIWLALVFLVATATYAASLANGFVWDDVPIIVKNAQNRDPGALVQILTGVDATRTTDLTPYYLSLIHISEPTRPY